MLYSKFNESLCMKFTKHLTLIKFKLNFTLVARINCKYVIEYNFRFMVFSCSRRICNALHFALCYRQWHNITA